MFLTVILVMDLGGDYYEIGSSEGDDLLQEIKFQSRQRSALFAS